MLTDLGLQVARSIPTDQLAGLATGTLKLHGGVIRDTAGRIVSHLAMPASSGLFNGIPGLGAVGTIINGIQLQSLSSSVAAVKTATEQVLSYSMATTALSGLGLVTSITGFAFLASRLKRIDQRLDSIEKQTKSIKRFLQSSQRAQLMAAIDHLRLSSQATDEAMRRDLLLQSKHSFTTLVHHYRSQLDEIEDIVELAASEECYMLACIGSVMATSDLGMGKAASDEMEKHRQTWQTLARQHCGRLLLGDDPARLLDSRYTQAIPTAGLIGFLDFVNGTQRGVQWIDELRRTLGKMTFVRNAYSTVEPPVIEYASKLLVKNEVLQGFSAHMGFLAEKKLSISYFANQVEEVREREGAEFLLLTHLI
ncbi:hypothetical protein [Thauera sp. Sel9]|uniref:hypothetical protein n=1 Tax=Thauera sp. Sel9 TaxID=2974299 RepID=UPI0021E1549B|nr:hypothetical protein [Thauera sp. Sel9]MCV2219003.1 hypothetical protein [Thauera sp. Sel9]